MSFKKKLNQLLSINVDPFLLDRRKQEELLWEFPEPLDLYQRSYFQYKIQAQLAPIYKRILNNVLGGCAIPLFILTTFFKNLFSKKKDFNIDNVAVFPYNNYYYPGVIPDEISNEFHIEKINFNVGQRIDPKDLIFIARIIKRYPFSPYFIFKCLTKILFYRYIIKNYSPKSIIGSSEYTFSSSIVTLFCRENDIEHINIMHGEKFFYIRDSFFEFDRFYVWDVHYIELFKKLRASASQFLIGKYPSMKINCIVKENYAFTYSYYLGKEDEKTLIKIKNLLFRIGERDKIKIRIHPRYSSLNQIEKIFSDFHIEMPENVSLEESFNTTEYLISLYSTILTQGFVNDKKLIIDDMSSTQKYLKLKEIDYVLLSKPHLLLSDILTH